MKVFCMRILDMRGKSARRSTNQPTHGKFNPCAQQQQKSNVEYMLVGAQALFVSDSIPANMSMRLYISTSCTLNTHTCMRMYIWQEGHATS